MGKVEVMARENSNGLTQLVDQASSGDADAWDEIVERMANMVWSIVRSFRLAESDAHDVAQMVWLRLVENITKVKDPERLGLWIATTTRRECMRLIEKKARFEPVDPDARFAHVSSSTNVESEVTDRTEAQRIADALVLLSDDCQRLLRLVLCDPPMSYQEIAAGLGIAVGTIGARRQRCLSRLRAAASA